MYDAPSVDEEEGWEGGAGGLTERSRSWSIRVHSQKSLFEVYYCPLMSSPDIYVLPWNCCLFVLDTVFFPSYLDCVFLQDRVLFLLYFLV